MSPRTGRPLSDNSRQKKVEVRMTDDELKKLDYCCKITKMTRSEVIRAGIDETYTKLREADKE